MSGSDKTNVDKPLFYGSALVTGLIVVLLLLFPEGGKKVLSMLFNYCTDQLGWAYIWMTVICFGIMLWLAFGKYKDVKFGGPDARVEFKTFSWVAMFFCAGIGTALLAWASKEWHFYYTSPPFGVEPKSVEAAEWAASYPIYHWGPLGWVIYSILAFPIGYAYWNRREGGLRFSTACSGVIGERNTKGPLGKFIDFLLIFGLFGANATTLGSGTPMLASAISTALGIEHTFMIDVFVLAVWSVLFTTSVALGLKKGIKNLSDINLWAVFGLCGLIFIVGPTSFMFNTFTDSVGIIVTNFFRMSFYTDPIRRSMFPQWWTVFYWAWYWAYAPYMGVFIARVSRGRTFKETVAATLIGGSTGCALFFMIFGNNALHQQLSGGYDFLAVAKDSGVDAAIIGALSVLPLFPLILGLFIFTGFVYSATTIDSSAYSMATVSCKDLKPGTEPSLFARIFWALVLAGVALAVMNIGSLGAVQTASLVAAFPILIFSAIAIWSFLKYLKEDQPQLKQPSPQGSEIESFLID